MPKQRASVIVLTVINVLLLVCGGSFADQRELSKVESAIKEQHAQWVAGETSISKLTPEERRMRLGLILPTDDYKEEPGTEKAEATEAPPSLDWRSNGGNFVTPIRDQGSCGSCWAFATTGALESATLRSTNTPNVDLNLAEQILVSCSGAGDCGGGYIESASNYLVTTGLPLETCYPYTASNGNCGSACANWTGSAYGIEDWLYVARTSPTVTAIKEALNTYGPLVTTLKVYSDFFYYTSGVYSYTSGSYEGGHAVLIVGYSDAGQYFIVKNSWGSWWGESGFFKIAYSQLSNDVRFGNYTLAYVTSAEPP